MKLVRNDRLIEGKYYLIFTDYRYGERFTDIFKCVEKIRKCFYKVKVYTLGYGTLKVREVEHNDFTWDISSEYRCFELTDSEVRHHILMEII